MTVANNSNDIFRGHRALGLVCNSIPFAIKFQQKRGEYLIFTAVGKHFHCYGGTRLNLLSISPVHNEEISALVCDPRRVYSAAGSTVYAWKKSIELKETYTNQHKDRVKFILPFGDHLITADEGGLIVVWNKEDQQVYTTIEQKHFGLSAIIHPKTYVNKILLTSNKGHMQLWNISKRRMVFEFKAFEGQQITAVEQSPAVDVVAVGLSSGRVCLHNLKFDETILEFSQDLGPVTAISFRTHGPSHMTTASSSGDLAVWDLEEQKIHSQLFAAHQGRISKLHYLSSEPIMISSGADNALKMWIFDQSDGGGRMLKVREGHAHPPRKIRFYDAHGHQILSGGGDSTLKSFSTIHDAYNRNLGNATYSKKALKKVKTIEEKELLKFPPVIDIASETTREKQWDSVVTVHDNMRLVQSWNIDKGTLGAHKLIHERFFKEKQFNKAIATCACMTSCGNFAIVGYSSGHVDRYNIQSGQHRECYGIDGRAHSAQVRFVGTDALNQTVMTAGSDALVHFWRFQKQTTKALRSIELEAPCSGGQLHRESGMVALALDNFCVVIVDPSVKRVVRKFSTLNSPVSDLSFSPDGRWVLGSTYDCIVRTWDIPTGKLISAFRTPSPVTSICFSPNGDFLATALADNIGIYLWANTTLYDAVKLRPLSNDFIPEEVLHLPSSNIDKEIDKEEDDDVDALSDDDDVDMEDDCVKQSKENEALLKLSDHPVSRWVNLLSMDVIRMRNKPKEAPKKPEAAPFFLPTIQGLEFQFDVADKDSDASSKVVKTTAITSYSAFANLVLRCAQNENYAPVMDKLKQLGPSAIEMEIKSFSPENGGSLELMAAFLDAMVAALRTKTNYELVNSYLALFMKTHGNLVIDEDAICERLQNVALIQEESWKHMGSLFSQSICIVNYLRSAVL